MSADPLDDIHWLLNLANEEQILVVDDDPPYCRSMQAVLTSVGLRSLAVYSVAAAKEALEQKKYCLVLLDLNMPGSEGPELIKHIQSEQIDSSVIVVSSEAEIKKVVDVIKLGARDFIRKPYKPEELLVTIKNSLINRNLEIQNRHLAEELKKSETQRQQTQKIESVGRLAGGIAHDFNNMLSAILGNVELALLKLGAENPAQKHLLQIKDVALRSAALTSQLLGFARKQPIAPQVIILNHVVNEMLHMLRRLIGEDIDLIWTPSEDNAKVLIDPSQLNQILTNLVVNARDAIETTGKLEIRTECVALDENYCRDHYWCKPGKYVLLFVGDDGCGMSREVQEHIFEPFYTTKAVNKGTGLGLATVYGIVKQNNGFVDVYSEIGLGTAIHIYLPESAQNVLTHEQDPLAQPAGGKETILLVEDEVMLLEIGQTFLEEAGYRVIATAHPEEALSLAKGQKIDLLLTDVIMPKLNGKELASRLLETIPELKVIYMSGYESSIIATRGLLEAGVELLPKPISYEVLLTKVREALDGKRD